MTVEIPDNLDSSIKIDLPCAPIDLKKSIILDESPMPCTKKKTIKADEIKLKEFAPFADAKKMKPLKESETAGIWLSKTSSESPGSKHDAKNAPLYHG